MPELPEVETMVRGIRSSIEGRILKHLAACRCSCRPMTMTPTLRSMRRQTVGRRVEMVCRIAKRVVIVLDSGAAFVIEPRMTGLMLLGDPPDQGHLRVRWDFTDLSRTEHVSLWYWDRRGLGTLRLLSEKQLSDWESSGRLGPDALEVRLGQWHERLAVTKREIKVALLDQALVAGIGNLYASEILHAARIHPCQRANSLTRAQIKRLHACTRSILRTAIKYEGSTLSDGTYRNALNQNGSYQNAHRVYARTHETCRSCRRGRIRRIVQAQRSTFYCPVCQPSGANKDGTP